jgi:hypothetical protein
LGSGVSYLSTAGLVRSSLAMVLSASSGA